MMRWVLAILLLAGCKTTDVRPLDPTQEAALERCEPLIDKDNEYFRCVQSYIKAERHCRKLGSTAGRLTVAAGLIYGRSVREVAYEDCLIRHGLELP